MPQIKAQYLLPALLAAWAGANWLLPSDDGLDVSMIEVPGIDLEFSYPAVPPVPVARRLRFDSAAALEQEIESLDYPWPPAQTVPMVEVDALPTDINELPVPRKKALFFRSLLPMVLAENQRIRRQRGFVESALSRLDELSAFERRQLDAVRALYRVDDDLSDPVNRTTLLRRVDIVPIGLVLAQAANESGWGTSRFARQANNLFGIWTWDSRRGLKPQERVEGATHSVRAYRHLGDSVRHYMLTLNTVSAYRDLRELRASQRRDGVAVDAVTLAGGLLRYSERGEAYVEEIRKMILGNGLHELKGLRLETG